MSKQHFGLPEHVYYQQGQRHLTPTPQWQIMAQAAAPVAPLIFKMGQQWLPLVQQQSIPPASNYQLAFETVPMGLPTGATKITFDMGDVSLSVAEQADEGSITAGQVGMGIGVYLNGNYVREHLVGVGNGQGANADGYSIVTQWSGTSAVQRFRLTLDLAELPGNQFTVGLDASIINGDGSAAHIVQGYGGVLVTVE